MVSPPPMSWFVHLLLLSALWESSSSEILEFEDVLSCDVDGEERPGVDATCSSRNFLHSCSNKWFSRPCKCDEDCVKYDECCYDTVQPPLEGTFVYPVPLQFTLPETMAWEDEYLPYMTCSPLAQYEVSEAIILAYYLVTKCPGNVPADSTWRAYCEAPPTSDDIFINPVLADGIGHFKNMYCALCHGVDPTTIESWTWNWRCTDTLFPSSVEDPDYTSEVLRARGDCSSSLEYPLDLPLNMIPRPCRPIDVDTCSVDYSNDPNNPVKCPVILAPVLHEGITYKNLECARCNGIDVCLNDTALSLCQEYPEISIVQAVSDVPALLEFFRFNFNDLQDTIAAADCSENEAYDPLSQKCQAVYCFPGFVFNGTTGQCERIPVEDEGTVCVSFRAERLNDTNVYMTSSDTEYLASAINHIIVLSSLEDLAFSYVINVSNVDCIISQNASQDDTCVEGDTIMCHTCLEFETNFTRLLESNRATSADGGVINETSCFFVPSYGNISISDVVMDIPSGWHCESYSSFTLQNESHNLIESFKVHLRADENSFVIDISTADELCGQQNQTLTCSSHVKAEAGTFEQVTSDEGIQSLYIQNSSEGLQQGEFVILSDGSALYCLRSNPEAIREALPDEIHILSIAGTALSVLCVFIIIITYLIFPKLRNVAGLCVLTLSSALLVTFVLMSLGGVGARNPDLCKALAAAIHFCWLSIFFWMNALAIDLNRTFGSRAKIRVGTRSQKDYIWYSLYAWGIPALIVGACLAIDLCDCSTLKFDYGGNGLCWLSRGDANLYGFGVPLAALLLLNAILFSDTVVGIRLTKKASERALKDRSALERAKEELSLYTKVSSVMGFTWVLAFICEYVDMIELWYLFTGVNSLQGVFILLAFGTNRRVTDLWREKLGCARAGESSSKDMTKSTSAAKSTVVATTDGAEKTKM